MLVYNTMLSTKWIYTYGYWNLVACMSTLTARKQILSESSHGVANVSFIQM